MIKLEELFVLVELCLLVYCLINVIQTPEGDCRNLPKFMWLMIVIILPLLGGIAWLVAGRPESGPRRLSAYERAAPAYPEYDRPGRAAASNPDDDEAFLRQVRERAEKQRADEKERRKREAEGQ